MPGLDPGIQGCNSRAGDRGLPAQGRQWRVYGV